MSQSYNSDVFDMNKYDLAKDKVCSNVRVFRKDDGFRFVYNEHGGELNPVGICCDLLCNIICVTLIDKIIHVVRGEGYSLKDLFTHDTCVPKVHFQFPGTRPFKTLILHTRLRTLRTLTSLVISCAS